jgi:PAS domain S-box-containing protein
MNGCESASARVLHVDDDEAFLDLATTLLERAEPRLEVTAETDPTVALERVRSEAFDCVVSDYRMPELDGIELLRQIRETDASLPFILFTADGSETVASEAISAGVTDYLQKETGSERYELLANRVCNAVRRTRAERTAAELERVSEVVREINRKLVRASTREQIERGVCETLSDSDPYRFAYVGEYDPETGAVEPTAWAGVEAGYLDELEVTATEEPTGRGPGGRAIRTREVAVVQDVRDDPEFEPWRESAIERGYRAVAGVPLVYRDRLYGLLGVYADRTGAFDDEERSILAELGADIAHAIHAVELREELRASRQKHRAVVDTAPDAIFLADAETGVIQQANEEATRLVGRPMEELVGLDQRRLHPPEDADRYRDLFDEQLGEDPTVRTELPDGSDVLVRRADGERVPVEINASTVEIGGERISIGIFRDVSQRREQARELARQNRRLERFARVLSHDLRTPLNVARGRLDLALDDQVANEDLAAVGDALDRTEDLVDHLSTLMLRGRVVADSEPTSLQAVVESAWTTASDPAASLAVEGDLGRVYGDESRLRELFENLFSNAVEHAGPDVSVTVGTFEDGFYVADDGPGIPEADREAVFTGGFTTDDGGTGWGLNIVREIAIAHDWSISISESAAGGARFEFHDVARP